MSSSRFTFLSLLFIAFFQGSIVANLILNEDFENSSIQYSVVGRGDCRIENGIFKSKDSYGVFGTGNLTNYRTTFKARAPKDAEQVQIWAGFRHHNRFDRYIVGLQGGLLDDLYLSRMGYMGTDELLALCELDFHPVSGEWYEFKIEVCGNRIRIFLNNEDLPRIDVIDKNSNLAPSGGVSLGGAWLEAEFDELRIEPLAANALDEIKPDIYTVKTSAQEKESKRKSERTGYKQIVVKELNADRTEISLNGNWLFVPDYEVTDNEAQAKPETADSDWHIMTVPNFWSPIRIWLHGETMNDGKFPKGVSDTYYQKETARCEAYTFDYKKTKAAWYRQWIELPEDISGKRLLLDFDAVSKAAEVYINGELAGSNVGMFGDFKVDGTKFFKPGKNLVAVKVARTAANSNELNNAIDFYYSSVRNDEKKIEKSDIPLTNNILKELPHGFYGDNPAGIWQPVSLVITNTVTVEDVFIKPALNGATFELSIKNHSTKKVKFDLLTDIVEHDSKNLFYSETSQAKIELKAGEEKQLTYMIDGLNPRLWTPQCPNLYDFKFKIITGKEKPEDVLTVRSGFRTFESKNGLFYLNGVPYWLRGGNHTPFALAPNDPMLANSFYQIMKAGNIEITRTHTSPYNKLWVNAADENGIGISHEGTWPWLMIHSTMPEMEMIEMWADEYIRLMKKYRNHPSILFWTVNNEMKFYDLEPDLAMRRKKMGIISDVVKRMREADPTRPISFDSNYTRNLQRHGQAFYEGIDDGDIDDMHAYINWYDHTIFKQFKGEFQRNHKNENRPLISQEMSTGYPNNETGHPTRFYTLVHQNPQTLVGYQAYAYGNPDYFLKTQSFITGELAEALRRSNDKASGIIHFALLTWFRNVYDAQTIEPYPTYYAMQRALQPVLVSAEIWGRNFYTGEKLPVRVCIANDLENGRALEPTILHWWVETETGRKLVSGKTNIPTVSHYGRQWVDPEIILPQNIGIDKTKAKLKIRLTEQGKQISVNEYDILLAQKNWCRNTHSAKKIVLIDNINSIDPVLDFINVDYTKANSIENALKVKTDLLILSKINKDMNWETLRSYIAKGGKVLILNSEEASQALFPEYITAWITPTEGDIVNMEIPESPVFNDIDLLGLRYFNNNKAEVPIVCHSALKVNRSENVVELANQTKIHGYIEGEMNERSDYVKTIKGFPIVKIIDGKGYALISTMAHEKSLTDPVAARLLLNMINHP